MPSEILKRDQNFVTVLAGVTNDSDLDVTMLRVDPISKRLLVAATGGSSGSGFQQPTSGTLNQGTFVWATAPNAIVVDGATYQKTDQAGNTNWTGTTTTVFTNIPWPTISIFSVS